MRPRPVDGAECVLERAEEHGRTVAAVTGDWWETLGVEGVEAPGAERGKNAG